MMDDYSLQDSQWGVPGNIHLVFPVIWYFIFGSWFKSQLGSLVSAAKGLYLNIFGFWKIATIRRRSAHIANVVPGPKPRTGFRGGDVTHCLLLWWYAVGADQAFQEVHCTFFGIWIICADFSRTKLHVCFLIFQSQCIGNGKRRRLVCPPS